jgi:pyruvate,water dikinase
MMNLGDPGQAFALPASPTTGWVARPEFIINTAIQAHPLALLHPERVAESSVRARLSRLPAIRMAARSLSTGWPAVWRP